MRNFSIQIIEVVKKVIPFFLRKQGMSNVWITPEGLFWSTPDSQAWGTTSLDKHLAWIKALLSPLQALFNAFHVFTQESFYKLSFNGQVIYLEHYLNDKLDPSNRGIYISDSTLTVPLYLYMKIDGIPTYIYKKAENQQALHLRNKTEYLNQTSFTIFVPSSLPITPLLEAQIRSLVNPFKLAGAFFTIQNY